MITPVARPVINSPRLPASPEDLLEDPAFARLRDYLVESTGLVYYAGKATEFAQRVIRRVIATASPDCVSYLDLLLDPLRGPAERDLLIGEVTIGETYFFRHREHFDSLRNTVLPDLLHRRRESRSLRIWSAGCSDGAEAYSLSILIRRDMATEFAGWQVSILGTDINRGALSRAREGEFDDWSFRSESPDLRPGCFKKLGARWRIAPQYKADVSFEYHNLAENAFPAGRNLTGFDLIVCRNVMIYFGSEMMNRLAAGFHEILAPGGWLLVGPTEPNMTSFRDFRIVNAPGVTLYQKPDSGNTSPSFSVPQPFFTPEFAPIAPPKAPPRVDSPSVSVPTLSDVRRHADQGAWENAERCCEQLLRTDNLNSSVHFYHALVFSHTGRDMDAERSLRRAIYLDRESILAHYYLGLQLRSRDDPQAARSFRNAVDLLAVCDPATTFADAGGITARELTWLAETHLKILAASPDPRSAT